MRAGDVGGVIALARATAEAPQWGDRMFEEYALEDLGSGRTGREHRGWVAVEIGSGGLAGFALGSLLRAGGDAEAELDSMAVAAGARRQGIGGALLAAFLEWAREAGAVVRLEVRASNAAAIRLYRRAGFVPSGARPGYYRNPAEDAILFALGFPGAERL
jgi:ribosomal-protein-alanine N-acetyltransferase